MKSARVRVRDRQAVYLEAGAGPPVVLVHGLGLSGRIYARNCAALADAGFRVIAPDLPGFGATRGAWFGQTVGETTEWLLDFADAVGVESAAWIGHSVSCQPVLALAARRPARAAALVLIAPTGAAGPRRLLRQVAQFAVNAFREPPATVAAVLREYVRGAPFAFAGTWLKAARDRPHARLRRVRCPTLILAGSRDPVIPRDYLRLLQLRIRHAHLREIPGAAHGAPFDSPAALDAAIAAFLRAEYA